MAGKDYPRIPAKNWWLLRKRFKQSMPSSISINYLSSLLGISERAAQNIMPHFKLVKILDEDGTTNDRTSKWRDDEAYPNTCQEIIREIYPEEFQSLVTDPVEGFSTAVSWFMRETGVGEAAAKQMARFYQLISKADPSDGLESLKEPKTKVPKNKIKSQKTEKAKKENATGSSIEPEKKRGLDTKKFKFQPSININLQIHISPDASTNQIEEIFKCIADHFNKMVTENE